MQIAIMNPGDLKSASESFLGQNLSEEEFFSAADRATKKLTRIIEREGDIDDEYLLSYLAMLISEAVQEKRFSDYTKGIKKEMPAANSSKANLNPYPYCSTSLN